MKVLLTGACGFVGSHIARHLIRNGHAVVSLDALTYSGALDNLADLPVRNVCHDLGEPLGAAVLQEIGAVDGIIHNAAESHVANSLVSPKDFVRSNVLGTLHLLEAARTLKPQRFIYTSTDEVLGPVREREPSHPIGAVLRPSNPYSATKAGGEYLVNAYWRSFGVPAVTTRTVNMFGERQHVEKFIPRILYQALRDQTVKVHASASGEVGSRCWCYAGEQARALAWLLERGEVGRVYHVSAGLRRTNLEMVQMLSQVLRRTIRYEIVRSDRPGHDLHYAIEVSPEAKNWQLSESFEELLARTARWYLEHPSYLEALCGIEM